MTAHLASQIYRNATQQVVERLPPGWTVSSASAALSAKPVWTFTSPHGESARRPLYVVDALSARRVRDGEIAQEQIAVTRYVTPYLQELLREQGIGYVDVTGNVWLQNTMPGLFIYTQGATKNPWPTKYSTTLRGTKAGHLVRALVGTQPPLGIRELARLSGANPGYVSRLVSYLDEQAMLERNDHGQIESVRWREILTQWADDAPLSSRTNMSTWLAPRGMDDVLEKLADTHLFYLLTGSVVASDLAPVAPARLLSLYAHDPEALASALGLIQTRSGANVVLLQSKDENLGQFAMERDGLHYAQLPLVVADLLDGPGRAPSEAAALMDWMEEHPEAWRE